MGTPLPADSRFPRARPLQSVGRTHATREPLRRASSVTHGPLFLALLSLAAPLSCSNGESPESEYRKALTAVEKAMATPAATWADKIAETFQNQVDQAGRSDPEAVIKDVAPQARATVEAGCTAVSEHKGALKKERDPGELPSLRDFPRLQLAKALAKFPRQLYSMKVAWPDAWLLSPAKPPDYGPPLKDFDDRFFTHFLKPEFVSPDGSILFPAPSTPAYTNLRAMLYAAAPFGNQLGYQSEEIWRGVERCIPND